MEAGNIKKYFIALLTILFLSVMFYPKDIPPEIAASIRIEHITDNELMFTWVLKNRSAEVITFDADCIMKIQLNEKDISYPYETVILNPKEEIKIPVKLNNIDPAIPNVLKITAISNQGTKVTIQQTIHPK